MSPRRRPEPGPANIRPLIETIDEEMDAWRDSSGRAPVWRGFGQPIVAQFAAMDARHQPGNPSAVAWEEIRDRLEWLNGQIVLLLLSDDRPLLELAREKRRILEERLLTGRYNYED